MKKILLIIVIVTLNVFSGCWNIRHISPKEFKKRYEYSKIDETMYYYEYLGVKDGKVFLKKRSRSYSHPGKWNVIIFCVELQSLDEELRKEIRSLNKKYTGRKNKRSQ
ncbi:MAG: hypothetical protein KAI63_04300 [Planctomycetes bacterium]|nr:hypothetical protein [Planctomycetota bacterium]